MVTRKIQPVQLVAALFIVPRARYHLLKNPAIGGSPTIERAATENAAMVQGIFLRIESSNLKILECPNLNLKFPATRNKQAFITA